MNHMTTYLKNKVLNDNLRSETVYAALFNENEEVNQPSYVRQPVTFVAPENGQTINQYDILFPVAEEVWGNVTHIGIFDTETGGNLLWKSPAEVPQVINVSSQYKIPQNYWVVRMR